MDERERQDEQHAEEPQAPEAREALEDLDVPEEQSEDVKGGTYSFKQAWPKKWDG